MYLTVRATGVVVIAFCFLNIIVVIMYVKLLSEDKSVPYPAATAAVV